jgi:hypothetical protein
MKEYRTGILRRAPIEPFTAFAFGGRHHPNPALHDRDRIVDTTRAGVGSGESEWWLVGILAVAAVVSAVLSTFTYRRHPRASPS